MGDVVQELESLLLFSLPVRKSCEKVVCGGYALVYFSFDDLSKLTDGFCKKNLFAITHLGEAYRGKVKQNQGVMGPQDVIVKIWRTASYMKVGAVYSVKPLDTLKNFLNDDKLKWKDRIEVALGLASLLDLLHGKKPQFLVRNICPDHIMIDQDKKPLLYDFSMLTVTGQVYSGKSGKRAAYNLNLIGPTGYRDPYYVQTDTFLHG